MDTFLKFVVAPLLSEADKLEVHVAGNAVTIHVAAADMGRVIGKHGNIISAIRNLVKVYCATHQTPSYTITLAEAI